jgi:hypothetical protein
MSLRPYATQRAVIPACEQAAVSLRLQADFPAEQRPQNHPRPHGTARHGTLLHSTSALNCIKGVLGGGTAGIAGLAGLAGLDPAFAGLVLRAAPNRLSASDTYSPRCAVASVVFAQSATPLVLPLTIGPRSYVCYQASQTHCSLRDRALSYWLLSRTRSLLL